MERTVAGPVPFMSDLPTPAPPTWPMRGMSPVAIRVLCAVVLLHLSAAFGRRANRPPSPSPRPAPWTRRKTRWRAAAPAGCAVHGQRHGHEPREPLGHDALGHRAGAARFAAFYTASGAYRSDFPRVR